MLTLIFQHLGKPVALKPRHHISNIKWDLRILFFFFFSYSFNKTISIIEIVLVSGFIFFRSMKFLMMVFLCGFSYNFNRCDKFPLRTQEQQFCSYIILSFESLVIEISEFKIYNSMS